MQNVKLLPVSAFLIFNFTFLIPFAARAETPADIQDAIDRRHKQIAEIEQQISEYWAEVDRRKAQGQSLEGVIEELQAKIRRSELEIRSLGLAIEESRYKLRQTESKIGEVGGQIDSTRTRLSAILRDLRAREEMPMILRFVAAEKISEMFIAIDELNQLHDSLKVVLKDLRVNKADLENVKESIEQEQRTQEQLRRIEQSQKEIAARRRLEQTGVLQKIEREKNQLVGKIVSKKRDLEKIKEQITYLGSVGVSVEEAVRYGELAAIRTGVRASFLIAVLEVESRLGLNVGTGYYKADMHPRDHEAFLAITGKLGLDPETTKVSRKPSYGWGGAMGPAQFLPNTWLAHETEVARLTGHNPPDPWNIEDAFTAAAAKLGRQGAAGGSREGERRAARAYIGGSPNCSRSICNYYANLVLEKAEEIEVELSKNGRSG